MTCAGLHGAARLLTSGTGGALSGGGVYVVGLTAHCGRVCCLPLADIRLQFRDEALCEERNSVREACAPAPLSTDDPTSPAIQPITSRTFASSPHHGSLTSAFVPGVGDVLSQLRLS